MGQREGEFPGVAFAVNTFLTERIEETIAGFAAPLVISLHGNDLDLLDRDAQAVASALSRVPGRWDVQVQAPPGTPQIVVRLRQERAAALGIAPLDCARDAVGAAYEGAEVAQVYQGNRVVSLVVVLAPEDATALRTSGGCSCAAADGGSVPLRDVADIDSRRRPLQDPPFRRPSASDRHRRVWPDAISRRSRRVCAPSPKDVKLAPETMPCSRAPRARRRKRAKI
jgi:Cu/Ag efflux pump CusA